MGYKRGDVVLVNLNLKKGEEIGKIRPAIIVSDDLQNEELDVVILVPLSTKLIDDAFPYRVRIRKKERLNSDSDALLYHLRAVSKRRVIEKLATLSQEELALIKEGICEIL